MPPEFERFRDLVQSDEELQSALWRIADTEQFVKLVVRLAADRGIALIESDVWQALANGRAAVHAMWAP